MKTADAITSSAAVAARPITPGAGVRPELVIKPGKRLRNWYRRAGKHVVGGLRFYARTIAPQDTPDGDIARCWLSSKGAR